MSSSDSVCSSFDANLFRPTICRRCFNPASAHAQSAMPTPTPAPEARAPVREPKKMTWLSSSSSSVTPPDSRRQSNSGNHSRSSPAQSPAIAIAAATAPTPPPAIAPTSLPRSSVSDHSAARSVLSNFFGRRISNTNNTRAENTISTDLSSAASEVSASPNSNAASSSVSMSVPAPPPLDLQTWPVHRVMPDLLYDDDENTQPEMKASQSSRRHSSLIQHNRRDSDEKSTGSGAMIDSASENESDGAEDRADSKSNDEQLDAQDSEGESAIPSIDIPPAPFSAPSSSAPVHPRSLLLRSIKSGVPLRPTQRVKKARPVLNDFKSELHWKLKKRDRIHGAPGANIHPPAFSCSDSVHSQFSGLVRRLHRFGASTFQPVTSEQFMEFVSEIEEFLRVQKWNDATLESWNRAAEEKEEANRNQNQQQADGAGGDQLMGPMSWPFERWELFRRLKDEIQRLENAIAVSDSTLCQPFIRQRHDAHGNWRVLDLELIERHLNTLFNGVSRVNALLVELRPNVNINGDAARMRAGQIASTIVEMMFDRASGSYGTLFQLDNDSQTTADAGNADQNSSFAVPRLNSSLSKLPVFDVSSRAIRAYTILSFTSEQFRRLQSAGLCFLDEAQMNHIQRIDTLLNHVQSAFGDTIRIQKRIGNWDQKEAVQLKQRGSVSAGSAATSARDRASSEYSGSSSASAIDTLQRSRVNSAAVHNGSATFSSVSVSGGIPLPVKITAIQTRCPRLFALLTMPWEQLDPEEAGTSHPRLRHEMRSLLQPSHSQPLNWEHFILFLRLAIQHRQFLPFQFVLHHLDENYANPANPADPELLKSILNTLHHIFLECCEKGVPLTFLQCLIENQSAAPAGSSSSAALSSGHSHSNSLRHQLNLNYRHPLGGHTALHVAAQSKNYPVLLYLLKHTDSTADRHSSPLRLLDYNVRNAQNRSPWSYLAMKFAADAAAAEGLHHTTVNAAEREKDPAALLPGLIHCMAQYVNSPALSDVRFVLDDGTQFYGHRIVFCAQSPVFKAMLDSESEFQRAVKGSSTANSKSRSTSRVSSGGLDDDLMDDGSASLALPLPEISSATFRSLLDYLYTGSPASLNTDDLDGASKLLLVSCRFLLEPLRLHLEKLLSKRVTRKNALSMVRLSHYCSVTSILRSAAEQFCLDHYGELDEIDHDHTVLKRMIEEKMEREEKERRKRELEKQRGIFTTGVSEFGRDKEEEDSAHTWRSESHQRRVII